ncbi:MAG: hypothetical protein HY006_03975 [Candidatus Sungbacteria bacterium]|nr:hypothetical protein [Candidatus Sungbacteria bacterium]
MNGNEITADSRIKKEMLEKLRQSFQDELRELEKEQDAILQAVQTP